jgi:casein kinase I homolog HRR25
MRRLRIKHLSTGDVYLATNIISREEVAIKMQPETAGYSQLAHEYYIYKTLANSSCTPLTRWLGVEHGYDAMVIDLLGPSLEKLFNECRRKFSLKTVLLLADQLVCILLILLP